MKFPLFLIAIVASVTIQAERILRYDPATVTNHVAIATGYWGSNVDPSGLENEIVNPVMSDALVDKTRNNALKVPLRFIRVNLTNIVSEFITNTSGLELEVRTNSSPQVYLLSQGEIDEIVAGDHSLRQAATIIAAKAKIRALDEQNKALRAALFRMLQIVNNTRTNNGQGAVTWVQYMNSVETLIENQSAD